jgi:phage head maturation protease
MNAITIEGYALPYNSIAQVEVDGALEQFSPSALDGMFPLQGPVDLLWADHSPSAARLASSARGTLSLFSDDYGIGFSAALDALDRDNQWRLREICKRQNPFAYASVGGLVIKASRWEKYRSANLKVITSAIFSHITITDEPAYTATAVWRADVSLDAAPWRIRDLASQWDVGRAQWREPQSAAVAARCSAPPRQSRAIGRTVTGDFVMMCTTTGRLSLLLHSSRAKSEI